MAGEGLDLTLIEPSPPGSFIGGGVGGIDGSPVSPVRIRC